MAHTNIDLDEKLLTQAMELTRAKTKKEVIHLGLRELIRLARLRGVREHRGKFHWRGDLAKKASGVSHDNLDNLEIFSAFNARAFFH